MVLILTEKPNVARNTPGWWGRIWLTSLIVLMSMVVTGIENSEAAPDNIISSVAIQSDGKIVIGGLFTQFNGQPRGRIARLNSDGSLDGTFVPTGSGFNGDVYTVAVQDDGKILVGGIFTQFNGTARKYLTRLNSNGSLDTTFVQTGTGFNGAVRALNFHFYNTLFPYPGERIRTITVGGNFTSYNGAVRNYVAQLNADGTLSSTKPGAGNVDGIVTALAMKYELGYNLMPADIAAGGYFTHFQRSSGSNDWCPNLVNFSESDCLTTGTGLDGGVEVLAFDVTIGTVIDPAPAGTIVVAGNFTSYNGTPRSHVARLSYQGQLDTTFNPGTLNGNVEAMLIQPDHRIILGGNFTQHAGHTRNYITRLNSNGSIDTTFAPTGVGFNNKVEVVARQSDGKIIVGGHFTQYDGVARNYIARLNSDGSLDTTFAS